jgi:hypothetical protein
MQSLRKIFHLKFIVKQIIFYVKYFYKNYIFIYT